MTALFPVHFENAAVLKRGKTILGPLEATIAPVGTTVLIGPNGAGKTTLLRLLHGLERANHGRVIFSEADREHVLRAQSFVFQKPIMLNRSALDNVAYPLVLRGLSRREARTKAMDMLAQVGLAAVAETRAPYLSGGEAQKLAIARALITGPELLILDEPTASLDASATQEIETLILEAAKSGVEIIMTTHHMGQARRLAKRIIFLHQGQILENTAAEEFWRAPATWQAQKFISGEIV